VVNLGEFLEGVPLGFHSLGDDIAEAVGGFAEDRLDCWRAVFIEEDTSGNFRGGLGASAKLFAIGARLTQPSRD